MISHRLLHIFICTLIAAMVVLPFSVPAALILSVSGAGLAVLYALIEEIFS